MTDGPRPRPDGTARHDWRFDPAMSDDELEAWAGQFVDAVLGDRSLPPEMDEHPPEIV
jgi:hypothetical protein